MAMLDLAIQQFRPHRIRADVTCEEMVLPPTYCKRHADDVECRCVAQLLTIVHVDVEQAPSATADVAVRSELPKLKPLTVTDSAPLAAIFMPAYDTTGPSNVKPNPCVPATAPTVTCTAFEAIAPKLPVRQPTEV